MKSLRELELEAYLAGALVVANLYARTEDAEMNNSRAFEAQVEETERLEELLTELEEDLAEADTLIFKLSGRIEVLEHQAWRLEQLEK